MSANPEHRSIYYQNAAIGRLIDTYRSFGDETCAYIIRPVHTNANRRGAFGVICSARKRPRAVGGSDDTTEAAIGHVVAESQG